MDYSKIRMYIVFKIFNPVIKMWIKKACVVSEYDELINKFNLNGKKYQIISLTRYDGGKK